MIEHLKKSKGGFTLVELIVVIAILAILSGIAVPVYSGYIAKANEAGDLQLLGALNTAYTAACAEMGLDPTKVVGLATLSGEAGSKRVSNVTASGSGAVALSGSSEEFFDTFKRYYGDNISTPFKVYESLGYDIANGVFVGSDVEGGAVLVSYKGGKLAISNDDIEKLVNSNLLSSDGTVDGLIDQVNGVQAMAALFKANNGATTFDATLNSDDFKSFFADITGKSYDDYTAGLSEEQKEKLNYNAFVLYAAKNAAALNTEDYLSNYDSEEGFGEIEEDFTGALLKVIQNKELSSEEIARAAIIYSAQSVGLANWDDKMFALGCEIENNTEYRALTTDEERNAWVEEHYPEMNAFFEDDAYYFTSGNARADAEGFLSAMSMIVDNLDDPAMVTQLLNDGFDQDLINSINIALGVSVP